MTDRLRSRSSCVWNSRMLRRIGDDPLDVDVLPVVKLPKKRKRTSKRAVLRNIYRRERKDKRKDRNRNHQCSHGP